MITPNTRLSDYFTVADLTPTDSRFPNTPTSNELPSLKKLASSLDVLRRKLGTFSILSGYRSPLVNADVGGVSTSRHLKGEAVDIWPHMGNTEKYWAQILADKELRNLFGEISYKKPQNSIHLSIPYVNSANRYVIGSSRVAEGSPMVYQSIERGVEKAYLAKYGLQSAPVPSTADQLRKIGEIQASVAASVQNLFRNMTPTTYTGKIYLTLGLIGIASVLIIKRARE